MLPEIGIYYLPFILPPSVIKDALSTMLLPSVVRAAEDGLQLIRRVQAINSSLA